MSAAGTIRVLALAAPLALLAVTAFATRPGRRERAAALLGFVWAAVGLAALNLVAVHIGWWRYRPADGALLGVPAELWLGWAVLWGPVPVLLRWPVPVVLIALGWVDVVAMPHLGPVVELGPQWLAGEAVGLGLVAAPAVLIGRWCAQQRHLVGRTVLQMVLFAGLVLWFGPAVAIDLGDGSWPHLASLPVWYLSLVGQGVVLVSLPGVIAVREFVTRGGGTPYPWDAPRRLVTTGPYAYVANPMQLSAVGLLLVMAGLTHSWSGLAAAAFGATFAGAVAGPHERDDLTRRHGAAWVEYRRHVRNWWPRWRPYVARPARLSLASTCDLCAASAAALGRLNPAGLVIAPAESHRKALTRARYDGPDGHHASGVAALAQGLEHVNLAWAFVAWVLRVPLIDRFAQIIVDGLGGGPRRLAPTGARDGMDGWPTPGRS